MDISGMPTQLPPRPDPQTGLPRPPRAPSTFKGKSVTPANREPRKAPPAPAGFGPRLEWRQDTKWSAIYSGILASLVVVAFGLVAHGLTWVRSWVLWTIIVLTGLAMFSVFNSLWVAAGADWLQCGKGWVATYELTAIAARAGGANVYIDLTDTAGRRVHANLRDVQANQALWDLVYNGVLHSVATRHIALDKLTAQSLRVPLPG